MNNLEAKQEAIKNAYSEYWDKVKDYVDENGWIFWSDKNPIGIYNNRYLEYKEENPNYWRPKSLQRIENNKGWIRIESEDDLPKNDMYVHIIFNKKANIAFLCNSEFYNPNKVKYYKKGVTHYKIIEESNLPIY